MYILLFLNYRLFVCACLCTIGDWYFSYFGLYTVSPLVVVSNMSGHMFNKIENMRTCFPKRGEYVKHIKIEGFHVVLAI